MQKTFYKRSIASAKLVFVCVFLAIFACGIFGIAFTPCAWAAYQIDSLDSSVQVQTTGAVVVSEQRDYAFDEPVAALKWQISGLTSDAEIQINSVRLIRNAGSSAQSDSGSAVVVPDTTADWSSLTETKFQSAWREIFSDTYVTAADYEKFIDSKQAASVASGASSSYFVAPTSLTWAFDEASDVVYIFLPAVDAAEPSDQDNCSYSIALDWSATAAVMCFNDVGEMYFDYVPATGDALIKNVRTTVALPVPAGASVTPGDNVIAWGHGAAGSLEVSAAGTVDFDVPEVLAGQYAQMHIIFPQSWLTNLSVKMKWAYSGTRRDAAVAEEAAWVDSWSASKINDYKIQIAVALVCIVAIIIATFVYFYYNRKLRSRSDVSAASLADASSSNINGEGALVAAGGPSVATISQRERSACQSQKDSQCPYLPQNLFNGLTPATAGRLLYGNHERIEDFSATIAGLCAKGVLTARKSAEGDVVFALKAGAKQADLSKSETMICGLLLDVIGGDFDVVKASDIIVFAKDNPTEFKAFIKDWQAELTHEVSQAGVFNESSKRAQKRLLRLVVVLAVVAIVAKLIGASWLIVGEFFVSAVLVGVLANYTFAMTSKGEELEAGLREHLRQINAAKTFAKASSQTQFNLLIFGFQFGIEGDVFPKIEDPTDEVACVFCPSRGKGGRKEACFLRRLTNELKGLGY